MRALLKGLSYPFRALGVIWKNPDLWWLILAPIGINMIVGGILYSWLFSVGQGSISTIANGLPEWISGLISGMIAIVLFLLVGYILVRFGVVLGSPFYGQLSERLEQRLTGQAPPAGPLSFAGIARDLWRAIAYELKKLFLTITIGIPLLLLSLIPVLGQVIGIGGQIGLGALIACLDFLDSPLERRRLRFRQKLAFVGSASPTTIGFGLICFGLVSIPLVNLLAIPLCGTAGTLLFCERKEQHKL